MATFRMADDWREADVVLGPYEIEERALRLPGQTVLGRTCFKAKEQIYAKNYLDGVSHYITRCSSDIGPYARSLVHDPLAS